MSDTSTIPSFPTEGALRKREEVSILGSKRVETISPPNRASVQALIVCSFKEAARTVGLKEARVVISLADSFSTETGSCNVATEEIADSEVDPKRFSVMEETPDVVLHNPEAPR